MKHFRGKIWGAIIGLLLVLPAQAMACFDCPMSQRFGCHDAAAPDGASLSQRCCCTMNGTPTVADLSTQRTVTLQAAPEVPEPSQVPVILPTVNVFAASPDVSPQLAFASPVQFAHPPCALAVLKSSFLI